VKDDVLEKTQNVIGLDDRSILKVGNLVETPAWPAVQNKATSLGSPVVPSRLAPRAAMSLKQTFAAEICQLSRSALYARGGMPVRSETPGTPDLLPQLQRPRHRGDPEARRAGLRMALTPFKARILYAGMLPLLGAVPKYSTMDVTRWVAKAISWSILHRPLMCCGASATEEPAVK
jgi:hypothetical protein